MMRLNFWKWYKQQTDFNFDEPAYLPRFVFGHYMKSYLSMFTKKYPNISTNYNKVQEIYTNSNIDETNLTYYICTTIQDNHGKRTIMYFNMWYICLP